MNYLAELKAFYDRLELNPLPSPAIALWHALMSIANKTGWQQEFTVALSILVLKSGLSESAVKRARNRLVQDGFITWKSRNGNQSAVYSLKSIAVQYGPQSEPQSEPQTVPQCGPQSGPQSEPINKLKHKQNNIVPPISPINRIDDFLSAYPKKIKNRQPVEIAYCRLLVADAHLTESDLITAAENYADACRILDTEDRYIKAPQNFLKDNFFFDYLTDNYHPPEPVKRKNNFNQFQQNSYDFGALEKDLLSR